MRKIIPYILILLVMLPVGLFGLAPEAEAQVGCWGPDPNSRSGAGGQVIDYTNLYPDQGSCDNSGGGRRWGEKPGVAPPDERSDLEKALEGCGLWGNSSVYGCIQAFFYFIFVTIPSLLLGLTALFFNFMAGLTLSSDFYASDFIEKIWIVIRDFSNIFFILVLLYAAFQIILDIGHGGGKKIIASVILMALLVNFSLFFTKIVIDASNVVALVFYNRIDTSNVASYHSIGSVPGIPEKDMAGALVSEFNVNKFFDEEFLDKLKQPDTRLFGLIHLNKIPTGMLIGIMVVYGLVIYALCYAFLIAGLSFLGRMLTLMMLMMVSPLAFVSLAVPWLKSVDTIGFDSWIKNLIKSSFVAAIFIFIIYIISVILKADVFNEMANKSNTGPLSYLILLFVPAIMIVILLLKGAAYAKKASGEFSGAVISGAKAIGGLALGGAALGAAGVGMLGRNTFGSVAKHVQNDGARQKDFKTFGGYKDWHWSKKINPLAYVKQLGKTTSAATATLVHNVPSLSKDKTTGARLSLGEAAQQSDRSFGKKQSSQNKLDSKADSEFGGKGKYDKGVKFKDLTETEQLEVRKAIDKDQLARQEYQTNFEGIKDDSDRVLVGRVVDDAYDTYERADKSDATKLAAAETQLSTDLGIGKKDNQSGQMIKNSEASVAIGEFVAALRKGSYDVRNISDAPKLIKTPLRAVGAGAMLFGAPILGAGILASMAGGLRAGLKKSATEYGTVQKDFLKDLGGVISGALKNINVKINLDTSSGGGHGGGSKSQGDGGGHH